MSEPKIYVNVTVDPAGRDRIEREEKAWTGPRLVVLCGVTLIAVFGFLYFIASVKSESYWDDWYVPGGVVSATKP